MKTKLNIAILGTRGIPNAYGGFEQCAEYLSNGLVEKGHQVSVYSSAEHPYQESIWKGVNIIHMKEPAWMGTAGQFIYDWNCIRHARRGQFDVVVQLGYTSSSIWSWHWPKGSGHLVNMDGLEHKRSKYGWVVKQFLELAERLAAGAADMMIADNRGIESYLKLKYPTKRISFIPYGVEFDPTFKRINLKSILSTEKPDFDLMICRMEPENHVREMIEAWVSMRHEKKELIVVGSTGNRYGSLLAAEYGNHLSVKFIGSIYDKAVLDTLRDQCQIYLHGHSVGGTNPSLLEAMAFCKHIIAHDNPFNRSVLKENGKYFKNKKELVALLMEVYDASELSLSLNRNRLVSEFNWNDVVESYETLCLEVASTR